MSQAIIKTIDLGDGRTISIETGRLAKQADGSVVVRMGDTMLLATVVSAREANENVDFMPVSVDYREKFSAAGRFPGGFLKRESRPSDDEILVARLVDRAIRPLFPEDYHAETAVMISLISVDPDVMPDSLAGLAASAAIAVSDVPFVTPISEVRVARLNGEFIINPSAAQLKKCDIDIMVAASHDNIMMVEGEMDEVSEEDMLEAIKVAHEAIRVHCKAQEELAAEVGVVKREYCHEVNDADLKVAVKEATYAKCYETAKAQIKDKQLRMSSFEAIRNEFIEAYKAENEGNEQIDLGQKEMLIKRYFHDVEKEAMRRMILDDGIRLDGRTTTQIRPIWGEVNYLPGSHGSAIFTRGETQSLSSITLGSKLNEKMIDGVTVQGTEKFMLHYNFPPFCVGEAKVPRGLGRREIGHGNLALRALKRMIPEDFPYVVRIVSDILESNGSSSMATVCAGTMCMLDSGLKMKRPVSGIAMGLITDKDSDKFAVLSDILGDEDHLGDMDFKVTGTEKGITATQMDIKVDGLSYEVLSKALHQAKEGRMHILGKILEVIAEPRPDFKPNVPRIETIQVPKDMIGPIIGPGGKNIQKLQEETNTVIVIEEIDGYGMVQVAGPNKEALDDAIARLKKIIAVPEKGEIYKGKVKSITSFGAFVEIMPGKEGLLHISEVSWERIMNVEDVLREGEEVEVKLIELERDGKLKLSRKVLLPKPEGYVDRPAGDRPPRRDGDRGGDRGGDRPRRDGDRGGDRRDNRGGGDRRDYGGDRRPPRDRN
ncbi:MAG: polyribonucleotide nucleotidyltransferase [Bacteroidetes bacterium GWF2_42_66]|nr:MAG: polyribonucleotide nucleotidyltransferase [Bacteroidetes bacterium GWE2_42_39]OFY45778.1 MAG: polyribonucleotide nucleotidyltransferase [Bacteroidetes bacterium GWF2_42_66]HBL74725.1 polyribonucleotide nucleotidyltransferase [Prolixibacteraceae bacterium]HCU60768.1 polyribonucleotide nucleotidyltransferase [Prolixibacteraceae bacterium]